MCGELPQFCAESCISYAQPNFLYSLVEPGSLVRLSVKKAAYADLSRVACRKSGQPVFSGRTRPLEWWCVPDRAPAPRTFFLAAPDRRMDALWSGNRRLLHPISSHAGTGGLPTRSRLFHVLSQLPFVCLLSFPLAAVYPVSVCPVSICGILVHSGSSMHRRISSHHTALE